MTPATPLYWPGPPPAPATAHGPWRDQALLLWRQRPKALYFQDTRALLVGSQGPALPPGFFPRALLVWSHRLGDTGHHPLYSKVGLSFPTWKRKWAEVGTLVSLAPRVSKAWFSWSEVPWPRLPCFLGPHGHLRSVRS